MRAFRPSWFGEGESEIPRSDTLSARELRIRKYAARVQSHRALFDGEDPHGAEEASEGLPTRRASA